MPERAVLLPARQVGPAAQSASEQEAALAPPRAPRAPRSRAARGGGRRRGGGRGAGAPHAPSTRVLVEPCERRSWSCAVASV